MTIHPKDDWFTADEWEQRQSITPPTQRQPGTTIHDLRAENHRLLRELFEARFDRLEREIEAWRGSWL